jgi:hypothetical protein
MARPDWARARALALGCAIALAFGVRAEAELAPQCPRAGAAPVRAVNASDIPVAHTPRGGYGAKFPAPVLAACTEPIAPGAPDLRGLWRTLRAEQVEEPGWRALAVAKFLLREGLGVARERKPVPRGDRIYAYVERIEQCGNRIVDIGGGTIADARADGSRENAVHDVSAFDYTTPITAIATFEEGVFVLRPPHVPIAITRRLDADGNLVWHRPDLGDRVVTLERIGGPCDVPPGAR